MYAAVAADEIADPFEPNRRVLSSPPKHPHISLQIKSRLDEDYSYNEVELPELSSNTFSTRSKARHLRKRWRFWQNTKDELKTVQWRKWGWHFLTLVSPIVLIWTLLLLTIWICIPQALFQSDDVCWPDGSFYYGLDIYNPWRGQSLFQIDVGFGHFSFATAKLIDVFWDLLVGRAGQLIMGYVSYKVFANSLIRHMEVHAVPTETFEAIAIQDHSMTGLAKLARGASANGDARSIISMVWSIIAIAYLLLFPSYISAGSGYSAIVEAYIEVASGSLVPWTEFAQVRYIIHDGERLGGEFYNDYAVIVPGLTSDITGSPYYAWGDCSVDIVANYDYNSQTHSYTLGPGASTQCTLLWDVAVYGDQSGYLGLNDSSSVFNNSGNLIQLDSPTLNISAYFDISSKASEIVSTDPAELGNPSNETGFYWKNPKTGNYTFGDVYNPLLIYNNQTFNQDQIQASGKCQQTAQGIVQYKWGFSFMLLFSLLVSLAVWCTGMYATYLDSYLHSRLDTTGRRLGLHRATLDLASAMEPFIPKDQTDTASNAAVCKLIAGCKISYAHLVSNSTLTSRSARLKEKWRTFNFKQFFQRDKCWCSLTLLVFIFWAVSFSPNLPLPPLICQTIILGGLLLVLYAGPESKARWLIPWAVGLLHAILTMLAFSGVVSQLFYFNPVFLGYNGIALYGSDDSYMANGY